MGQNGGGAGSAPIVINDPPAGGSSSPIAPGIGSGGAGGGVVPPGGAPVTGGQPVVAPGYTNQPGMTPYQYQQTFSSGSSDQQQNVQGQSNQATDQNQLNSNTYDPASLALRNQGAGSLAEIMATGQLPGNFGISKQAFDALNSAFERNIAPGMAAQFGAGSPAIASQEALMNEQLAATLGQQQWQNYQGIFNDVSNFAFTPTGQQSTMGQTRTEDTNSDTSNTANWQSNNTAEGSLLSSLLTAAKTGGKILGP